MSSPPSSPPRAHCARARPLTRTVIDWKRIGGRRPAGFVPADRLDRVRISHGFPFEIVFALRSGKGTSPGMCPVTTTSTDPRAGPKDLHRARTRAHVPTSRWALVTGHPTSIYKEPSRREKTEKERPGGMHVHTTSLVAHPQLSGVCTGIRTGHRSRSQPREPCERGTSGVPGHACPTPPAAQARTRGPGDHPKAGTPRTKWSLHSDRTMYCTRCRTTYRARTRDRGLVHGACTPTEPDP